MKKAIKRFWGIGLIVIILSTLFVSAVPASAKVYKWDEVKGPKFETVGLNDIAQTADGSTIYVVNENDGTGTKLLKSTSGGTAWDKLAPGGGAWGSLGEIYGVAVAPDDATLVAVVDENDTILLSTNGGGSFSDIVYPGGPINDISISAGPTHYIAVAADDDLYSWKYGDLVPSWDAILAHDYDGEPTGVVAVNAAEYSPAFASDQALLVVAEIDGGNYVSLEAYSYNVKAWNADGNFEHFPGTLVESSNLGVDDVTCDAASISLDPAFYMGDTESQIGFVGATITDTTDGDVGGVFSISAASGGEFKQIYDSNQIASVAWDGTNLVAAPYVDTSGNAIQIYRSANALAGSPSFSGISSYKTPGTGERPKVVWNGGNVLCISADQNGGVALSANLGKSFNGIALLNTNMDHFKDFNVSADGSVLYATASDGNDLNCWRLSGGTWERILIKAGGAHESWMVRTAVGDPTAVTLGLLGEKTMLVSTDSGETKWLVRSASKEIADFALETKDIVYVAGYDSDQVVKSINGAFTWGGGKDTNVDKEATGSTIYSMTLVSAGNLLVGGTEGTVAYSSDGGSTWTGTKQIGGNEEKVVAVADGCAEGDHIWAVSSYYDTTFARWTIGGSSWKIGMELDDHGTGIALANGVVYAEDYRWSDGATWRFLSPTGGIGNADMIYYPDHPDVPFGNVAVYESRGVLNSLQASTDGDAVTLWARDTWNDKFYSWTEYSIPASAAPTTIFPPEGYNVPVNSISGEITGFTFQWNKPNDAGGKIASDQKYSYTLEVYMDAATKIKVGKDCSKANTGDALLAVASNDFDDIEFYPEPGQPYYYRVKATYPVSSQWSPLVSFVIQSMQAAVAELSSPENGATIQSQMPAFSWTPITGATSYDFELSSTANFAFGTIVYSSSPTAAGAQVDVELEQGTQYFWRVRVAEPSEGEWSTVGNFMVAVPVAPDTSEPVVITSVPAPVITIPPQSPAPVITFEPQSVEEVAPGYIWAIIIIGGVLVIAVIVLIVRTRRSV